MDITELQLEISEGNEYVNVREQKMARDREPFTMKSVRDNTVVNSARHVLLLLGMVKLKKYHQTRSDKSKQELQKRRNFFKET